MTHHTLLGREPKVDRPGFSIPWFATVDVAMNGSTWQWCLVDQGKPVGAVNPGFATEDAAKADALETLDGDEWES
ncbi:hypothetical protein [Cupriavidus malaysiensis]|uniref:Uncharacterized protein n=1 Tax=Cupriavidus malaysiensis TaxID=367825 RepID=A0ABN4TVW1_9BURK|nr:hypothetical protein [Cupriavidus malaysiensis]AOZ11148.1 hypothetical protein BKK80_34910 [Cupriavidus malaysiensis]